MSKKSVQTFDVVGILSSYDLSMINDRNSKSGGSYKVVEIKEIARKIGISPGSMKKGDLVLKIFEKAREYGVDAPNTPVSNTSSKSPSSSKTTIDRLSDIDFSRIRSTNSSSSNKAYNLVELRSIIKLLTTSFSNFPSPTGITTKEKLVEFILVNTQDRCDENGNAFKIDQSPSMSPTSSKASPIVSFTPAVNRSTKNYDNPEIEVRKFFSNFKDVDGNIYQYVDKIIDVMTTDGFKFKKTPVVETPKREIVIRAIKPNDDENSESEHEKKTVKTTQVKEEKVEVEPPQDEVDLRDVKFNLDFESFSKLVDDLSKSINDDKVDMADVLDFLVNSQHQQEDSDTTFMHEEDISDKTSIIIEFIQNLKEDSPEGLEILRGLINDNADLIKHSIPENAISDFFLEIEDLLDALD